MNLIRSVGKLAAVAALSGTLATPALADGLWACGSVTFKDITNGTPGTGVAFNNCKGSYDPAKEPAPGNDGVDDVNWVFSTTAGFTPIAYQYKDNIQSPEVGSDVGVVDFEAGSGATGTVTFGTNLFDPFVLTLKFGKEWSAYWFNVDVLAGSVWSFGTTGTQNTLSHGSLFTTAPIPEPETYALMLAGLGAVTFVARRRKMSGR